MSFDENHHETRIPMFSSGDTWHIFVAGVQAGTKYGYRVKGIQDEQAGLLFNPQKLLTDPYAKAIEGKPDLSSAEAAAWYKWNDERDNASLAPKSIVIDEHFDWENDSQLFTPWAETIIYEMQVKGFSQRNFQIPSDIRGTFAGLAHPVSIDYLKTLGITAVELLPVTYHIDETHLQKQGLVNYWGYNVLGNFAIDPNLAADKQNPLKEFKQLVKTLHQAHIEVIMDIVFNHTAESDKNGPMLSFRGIDNTAYWLDKQGEYENWTGCGNTLNLSNPYILCWAIDCLIYWVEECHIDGFRFDLASILGRTPSFSEKADFFTALKSHSKLTHIKLIAEPWDIGVEGYQLGQFLSLFISGMIVIVMIYAVFGYKTKVIGGFWHGDWQEVMMCLLNIPFQKVSILLRHTMGLRYKISPAISKNIIGQMVNKTETGIIVTTAITTVLKGRQQMNW